MTYSRRPSAMGGKELPDDYVVLAAGRPIGRTYLNTTIAADRLYRWFWRMDAGTHREGQADCLATALKSITAAFEEK